MATSQGDNKGVQTDPNIRYNNNHHRSMKFFKKLQMYITAVSRYRLNLFHQYIQSNESYINEDLFNVRKKILNRFQIVINELEQAIENLQSHRLSINDIQQILDQSHIKEVIETSINENSSFDNNRKEILPNIDEWKMYRRDLQETKEDLHILDLLLHRGILKIDRLVNVTSLYI